MRIYRAGKKVKVVLISPELGVDCFIGRVGRVKSVKTDSDGMTRVTIDMEQLGLLNLRVVDVVLERA